MATRLQLRRGTKVQNDGFTGAEGELTYSTDNKGLRIHDGTTVGGMEVPVLVAVQRPTASNNYTWCRKWSDGWVEQGGWVAGTSAATATVTLPVEMADTKYYASITNTSSNTGDSASMANISVWNRTTTSFDFRKQANDTYWRVEGMAA